MDEMEKAIFTYAEYKKVFRSKLDAVRNSNTLTDHQKEVEEDGLFEEITISAERRDFHSQSKIAEGNRQLMKRFGGLFLKHFHN